MAEPKKRTSSRRKNNRRSHHALKKVNLVKCKKCKALKKAHTTCKNCSSYK